MNEDGKKNNTQCGAAEQLPECASGKPSTGPNDKSSNPILEPCEEEQSDEDEDMDDEYIPEVEMDD